MTEADTCRKFVVPLLQKAGWDNELHAAGWLPSNVAEIACKFGGVDELRGVANKLQSLLYAS